MSGPTRRDSVIRIGLVLLGAPSVLIGAWAGLAPRSFYDDFPGFGRVWVASDGPFNEHLVRDVGWLNLALAFVTFIAAWKLGRLLVGSVLGAWLLYGVPHLVYHLNNLDAYDTGDQIALTASLALAPVIAVVLLALRRQGAVGPQSPTGDHDRAGGRMESSRAGTGSSGSNT